MVGNYDLKPEDQLLLNCSLTLLSGENIKRIKQLTNQDLDWNYLIDLAYKHRLSPLLYWHLNRSSPEAIPSNLKLELKEHFHKNVQKNLMMFKELLEVVDILQKQGVVPIPYKGPVLAILIYKNLGFRIFGDLDFYVPIEDVPRTRDILVNEGYEPWEKLTSAQEKSFYKFQREYHFINKLTGINLEIKWKFLSTLIPTSNEPVFQENEFFKEVNLDQFKVKTISPEYLILILSIHNASHAYSSLYRFCDISELIRYCSNIKWEYLLKIADDWGVKRIFLINLKILRELFQIQLPGDVLELINNSNVDEVSKDIVKRLFTSKPRGVLEKVVFHSNLREKRKDKLKTILIMIFLPTPGVIESVSLPRALEPLYYILRVFQMVKNVITNQ
ncbi:nucleotidyltransferase family protein [Methanobacterium sp. BAmetb5]|uniref:nucleotidyltransferase domain-containing protein n=1 Tax=Methanobacterium sp. BAmetb5 TaxID=2025351 RepID=UPI000E94123F|nr:nucleotidyltransferase family protein [Methanobacterium sp. BAmetb5]AXV38907.1 MAG: hypothetical protein CIT02_00565 [Methanobacterium sp. BAmetb5]